MARFAPFPSGLSGVTLVCLLAVAGCQSAPSGPDGFASNASQAALPVMERVALAAGRCWFKSGAAEFQAFRMAPELNSFSGRPRLLLVPRRSPESRPLAVIEAEGSPARVQVFGPLLDQPVGARIAGDVKRWIAGDEQCTARA